MQDARGQFHGRTCWLYKLVNEVINYGRRAEETPLASEEGASIGGKTTKTPHASARKVNANGQLGNRIERLSEIHKNTAPAPVEPA